MSEPKETSPDSDRSQILSHLVSNSASSLSLEDNLLNLNSQNSQTEVVANPWLRKFILLGYAAKGVVYFSVGVLAIEAAILPEQKAAGTYAALKYLSGQPLGSIFLCMLAVGLMGYVLRRLLQAIIYPGHSQDFSPKRLLQRLGYLISSLSYAGIAYSALNIVFKLGKYDDAIQNSVEQLFKQPVGEWLVLAAGIAVSGIGFAYLRGAYTGSYVSKFSSSYIHHRLERYASFMGKFGIAARGIAFILIGICLIIASLLSDSNLAGGLQNAFQILAAFPLGELGLGLIGSGFIAYGVYMFVAAVYRRYAVR